MLKTSWGISIFLNIQDRINETILISDRKIYNNIYLRLINNLKIDSEIVNYWFSLAIRDIYHEIEGNISKDIICFDVESIDFSFADFQEEGLYYAMQGWLSQKYSILISESDANYSIETNTYIFPKIKHQRKSGEKLLTV